MKCIRCGRENTIITLPYNGDALGPNCFAEFFERRARKTIRSGKLLRFDDTTAVALSGRLSSSVLLYILSRLSSDKKKSRVFALTVEGCKKSVDASVKLCNTLSVEHHILTANNRDLEDSLTEKAKNLGATKIAFGVNLDDEVRDALKGFLDGNLRKTHDKRKKESISKIKPLRECPVEEVETYARIKKIPFEKEKNRKDADFDTRKIIELLEKTHPGIRFQILTSKDYLGSFD